MKIKNVKRNLLTLFSSAAILSTTIAAISCGTTSKPNTESKTLSGKIKKENVAKNDLSKKQDVNPKQEDSVSKNLEKNTEDKNKENNGNSTTTPITENIKTPNSNTTNNIIKKEESNTNEITNNSSSESKNEIKNTNIQKQNITIKSEIFSAEKNEEIKRIEKSLKDKEQELKQKEQDLAKKEKDLESKISLEKNEIQKIKEQLQKEKEQLEKDSKQLKTRESEQTNKENKYNKRLQAYEEEQDKILKEKEKLETLKNEDRKLAKQAVEELKLSFEQVKKEEVAVKFSENFDNIKKLFDELNKTEFNIYFKELSLAFIKSTGITEIDTLSFDNPNFSWDEELKISLWNKYVLISKNKNGENGITNSYLITPIKNDLSKLNRWIELVNIAKLRELIITIQNSKLKVVTKYNSTNDELKTDTELKIELLNSYLQYTNLSLNVSHLLEPSPITSGTKGTTVAKINGNVLNESKKLVTEWVWSREKNRRLIDQYEYPYASARLKNKNEAQLRTQIDFYKKEIQKLEKKQKELILQNIKNFS